MSVKRLMGLWVIGFVVLFVLGGCTPTGKIVNDCVWPDAQDTAAPLWVCDAPVEGVAVSAVGMSPKSGAGPGYMKTLAAAEARAELARQMKVHVKDLVKSFVQTTGVGDNESVDALHAVIDKQVTDQYIEQSRIFRSATSPNDAIYVLVGLDAQIAQAASKSMLNTSFKNDQALWQQFQAQKGYDELAEEILKEK